MLKPGYAIDDRYKVIRLLGEGGMANVYLANDLILNREVAIKILRLDLQNNPQTVRRFQREALATTELNHPNIVNVYDVGEDDHLQYIVMEYVKGTDLKQYITQNFPIPYQKVIDMMQQILAAVQQAHEHHIIHRDLKPQNILVDESGQIKIGDFGIALALSETAMTQTNTMLGSVHYLSPEQAKGTMATKQSDIYSLGIILYELLTGKVPFEGESAVSVAVKHFQSDMPSVREFDPRIPQALENVVLKATCKKAENRYTSAALMATDLKTALLARRANEPIFVPPVDQEELAKTKIIPGGLPIETDNQNETKKTPKKSKKIWLWALLATIIVVGALVVAFLAQGKEVKLPDVTDMTTELATEVLKEKKIEVDKIKTTHSSKIAKGHVIKTNPTAGTSVKTDSKVDLIVSSGVKKFTLDDYTGLDYDTVSSQLRQKGFTVLKNEKASDTQTKGVIMGQDILKKRKVVPEDTTITFTVSKGEATFQLRDFTGYTKQAVNDYIESVGLSVVFQEKNSDDVAIGQVISQQPAAKANVKKGDQITVTLSSGPQKAKEVSFTKEITIPYLAPESTETSDDFSQSSSQTKTNLIKIYLEDKTHQFEQVYRSLTISEDVTIKLPFVLEEGKSGRYKIMRDDQIIMSDDNVTE